MLEALKCSCCLPGVFKPQSLYGQLYVDGGLFVPCISWIHPDALVLSLTKHKVSTITPNTIQSISPLDYMKDMYAMAVNHFITLHKSDMVLNLSYPDLYSDSDLNEFDVSAILDVGEQSMRRFLISKSLLKESTEVGNIGSTDHLV